MFALSSIGSSLSGVDHLTSDERSVIQHCFTTPTSSTDDDDDESSTESIYHDVLTEESILEDEVSAGDAESWTGTILASLSSKEVRENLTAGLRAAEERKTPRVQAKHPLARARTLLSEVATVPSDVLSFTPTMAELAMSRHDIDVDAQSSCPSRSEADNPEACRNTDDSSTGLSTYGGKPLQHVQPARIACPFCDHEKDLQWRLSSERKRSQRNDSANGRRLVVVATIVAFLVAVVAFFLGKLVSDIRAEKAMATFMAQCNEMMTHKEEEELYWKLVSAAFSAIVNAAAGPVASFVIGAGKN